MKSLLRSLVVTLSVFPILTGGMSFAEAERGKDSYYADSLQGNKTASGEP